MGSVAPKTPAGRDARKSSDVERCMPSEERASALTGDDERSSPRSGDDGKRRQTSAPLTAPLLPLMSAAAAERVRVDRLGRTGSGVVAAPSMAGRSAGERRCDAG